MKRITAFIVVLSVSFAVLAQEREDVKNFGGKEKVKHGFNSVPYPVIGWSDDLGVQYGVNYTLFNYGDGSMFPNYKYKIVAEASRYSRGQTGVKMTFNSAYVIPGIKLSAAVAYNWNPMYQFYGFNGESYQSEKNKRNGLAYYNFDRKFVRAVANFQGDIVHGLRWAAGLNYLYYKISDINTKYGYAPGVSLYRDYIGSGMIHAEEANGGSVLEFNAGLVYDTRDATSVPTKGIWAEFYLTGTPDIFKTGYHYSRLSAHFRQYLSPSGDDRFTIAYHLAYQDLISGEAPFYILQNITSLVINKTVYEGLGNKHTIRGTRTNAFIANGYAWGNLEARIKLFSFILMNQAFYISTNPFFDCGAIVHPFRLDAERGSAAYRQVTKLHETFGAGLKIVMNKNFVMGVEAARPVDPADGGWRFIYGTNYLF